LSCNPKQLDSSKARAMIADKIEIISVNDWIDTSWWRLR
jgi:hypothetical protein